MSGNDRSLIGIIAGVVVLVVVAFVAVRSRPQPTYREDDAPEAVAHNYLLAMEHEEWARAYGYLSPSLPCYPESSAMFADDITQDPWIRDFDSVELRVQSANVEGDIAVVTVRETRFMTEGLFQSSQTTRDFEMKLQREADGWRIVRSDAYWWWNWSETGGRPCREGRSLKPAAP